MKRILLFCNGGFSTSILADKINNEFEGYESSANDILNIDQVVNDDDVIVLGPQVCHREEEIKEKFSNNTVIQLTMVEFGMMDAESIINRI